MFSSFRIVLTVLAIILIYILPVFAEEEDFDDIITRYERTFNNGQVYTQFPPTAPPVNTVQTVNTPWYKKLFSPFVKHASPPIDQAPKVQKEPARETVPLSDPLIRLARSVTYEGKTIPPGFYLLGLQPENNDKGAFLKLFKKQQTVLEVPAMALSPSQATTLLVVENSYNSTLPSPPPYGQAFPPFPDTKEKNDIKKTEEAVGTVEISQNGETLILVYQKGSQHYTSIPLTVLSNMQPE